MNTIDDTDSNAPRRPTTESAERGLPNLKLPRKRSNVSKLWIVLVLIVALAVAAAGIAAFVKGLSDRHLQEREDARTLAKQQTKDDGTGHDFEADKARLAHDRALAAQRAATIAASNPVAVPAPSGAIPVTPVARVGNAPNGTGAAAKTEHVETVAERRLDGDVLIKPAGAGSGNAGAGGGTEPRAVGLAAPVQGGLDGRLTPSTLASVTASRLPDLSYLLKRGVVIPCAQKTKIVTTYPGMTSCNVTEDVYSADGHTLLVEKNSEATGEQRTALMQGQARIFVLWSRIDTPSGITLNLDSPGTDALGASGLEAFVDTHFWQRFGGALMLSLVGTASQALSSRSLGGSNNQINLSSASSSSDDLATETLKNTINIPPTAFSNQGSALNIFVARDIDFRSVYELVHE